MYMLPSRHLSLNKTRCSKRNLFICSSEEKLISRDTARHRRIFLGTRANSKIFKLVALVNAAYKHLLSIDYARR